MHLKECRPSCAPILRFFSATSDGNTTERQIPNSTFSSISWKDSVDNVDRFGRCLVFTLSVRGRRMNVLYNALHVS